MGSDERARGAHGDEDDEEDDDFDLPPDESPAAAAADSDAGPPGPPGMHPDAPEVDEDDPYAALHAMRDRDRPKLEGPLNRSADDGPPDDAPPAGRRPRPAGRGGRSGGGRRASKARTRHRDYEVGEALGKTFSTWGANFIPFALITALLMSPIFLIQGILVLAPPNDPMTLMVFGIALILASLFMPFVVAGSLIHGVFNHLTRQPVNIGQCLGVGLLKLLPVLATTIVFGVILMLPMFLPIAAACSGSGGMAVLAMIIAVVSAAYLYTRFMVAVPAVVVERIGPLQAITRASYLSEGNRLMIFLTLLVYFLILVVCSLIPLGLQAGLPSPILVLLVQAGLNILTTSLNAVLQAVIYHDLRVSSEGIDTKDLASVFD